LEDLFPFTSSSVTETVAFGKRLGSLLRAGDVVALHGDLGTGKTHLVKGLAASMRFPPETVSSPTFSIVNEYPGDLRIFHFDLYRIQTDRELLELGIDEYLDGDALVVLEWPEIAAHYLPDETINLYIEHAGGDRRHFHLKQE
jgi:tRNA threonylcarbamoyladenosine biosynthesis protein TsaE